MQRLGGLAAPFEVELKPAIPKVYALDIIYDQFTSDLNGSTLGSSSASNFNSRSTQPAL
jgi:hypothetical protein